MSKGVVITWMTCSSLLNENEESPVKAETAGIHQAKRRTTTCALNNFTIYKPSIKVEF